MRNSDESDGDLLDNTLDDVKLVAADNDFLALVESVEGVEFGLDPRTENVSRNTSRVDTDGTVTDGSDVTLDVDTFLIGGGLVTTDANAGRDKVALVGICLEADDISAEHPIEYFLSTWIGWVVSSSDGGNDG